MKRRNRFLLDLASLAQLADPVTWIKAALSEDKASVEAAIVAASMWEKARESVHHRDDSYPLGTVAGVWSALLECHEVSDGEYAYSQRSDPDRLCVRRLDGQPVGDEMPNWPHPGPHLYIVQPSEAEQEDARWEYLRKELFRLRDVERDLQDAKRRLRSAEGEIEQLRSLAILPDVPSPEPEDRILIDPALRKSWELAKVVFSNKKSKPAVSAQQEGPGWVARIVDSEAEDETWFRVNGDTREEVIEAMEKMLGAWA